MIFISVLLLIALDIRSCAKTREVTLVHELEIPAYTEYNLGTAASDKVTKLLHYEVCVFYECEFVHSNVV